MNSLGFDTPKASKALRAAGCDVSNAGTAVGKHRTSKLQDLDAGRPMEIDALVTAVRELGRLVEVPTPTIDVVLALIQQRGESAGTYKR